ncbi:acetylglutamate kinase [Kallotenue papyrolyticum]|uniref:acetylglutamate kinase n=1 Tax=Kallotenue papyrolyticum TaxID=1325125 RepID=UPI000492A886|nr:acetylglutamate kinase [Kallotenue papyrolyticum]
MYVLKIGGNEIDQPAFLEGLSAAVAALERPAVIVHGGGKEIAAALQRQGLDFEIVDGMRATSPAAMAVVEQVLSGAINKRLVARLNAAGVPALGLSGVDLHLLQTRPLRPGGRDLGRVGEIVAVRVEVLRELLALGWLPVISPVSVDQGDQQPTNVNADHAALAVAAALRADELIFISNVPGVLIDGAVAPQLTPAQIEAQIASGAIAGGMLPKVRAAVEALTQVRAVRITNLDGLRQGSGTRIVAG